MRPDVPDPPPILAAAPARPTGPAAHRFTSLRRSHALAAAVLLGVLLLSCALSVAVGSKPIPLDAVW